jgi:hypothetical protein
MSTYLKSTPIVYATRPRRVIDWWMKDDKTLPLPLEPMTVVPDGELPSERRRRSKAEAQRRYNASDKGRAVKDQAAIRFRASDKGKAAAMRSRATARATGRHKEISRASRAKRRRLIHDAKSVPCADCGGVFDPVCMDFDHRPGTAKLFTIGSTRVALDVLYAEMKKCDVVCSNCHRIRTFRKRDHSALIQERLR